MKLSANILLYKVLPLCLIASTSKLRGQHRVNYSMDILAHSIRMVENFKDDGKLKFNLGYQINFAVNPTPQLGIVIGYNCANTCKIWENNNPADTLYFQKYVQYNAIRQISLGLRYTQSFKSGISLDYGLGYSVGRSFVSNRDYGVDFKGREFKYVVRNYTGPGVRLNLMANKQIVNSPFQISAGISIDKVFYGYGLISDSGENTKIESHFEGWIFGFQLGFRYKLFR